MTKRTKKNALEICGNYEAKLPDSLEAIKALSNWYQDGSFWAQKIKKDNKSAALAAFCVTLFDNLPGSVDIHKPMI